jgi:hypothetical protein
VFSSCSIPQLLCCSAARLLFSSFSIPQLLCCSAPTQLLLSAHTAVYCYLELRSAILFSILSFALNAYLKHLPDPLHKGGGGGDGGGRHASPISCRSESSNISLVVL